MNLGKTLQSVLRKGIVIPAVPLALRGDRTFELLLLANEITDANTAFFEPAHHLAGCIPCLHTVLVSQGILEGPWCLDPAEQLSLGQYDEIARIHASYPHLNDHPFVAEHRDR